MGANVTDTEWLQAQPPVTKTGLGLRSADKHSSSAFLSSIAQSETWISQIVQGFDSRLLNTDVALIHYSNMVGETEVLDFDQISHESQKSLSHRLDSTLHEQVVSGATSVRNKARLGSLGLANSGSWLNSVPNPTLGLHMRLQKF